MAYYPPTNRGRGILQNRNRGDIRVDDLFGRQPDDDMVDTTEVFDNLGFAVGRGIRTSHTQQTHQGVGRGRGRGLLLGNTTTPQTSFTPVNSSSVADGAHMGDSQTTSTDTRPAYRGFTDYWCRNDRSQELLDRDRYEAPRRMNGFGEVIEETVNDRPAEEEETANGETRELVVQKYFGGFADSGFTTSSYSNSCWDEPPKKSEERNEDAPVLCGFGTWKDDGTSGATGGSSSTYNQAKFGGFGVDFTAIMERSKKEEEAKRKWEADHPIKKDFYEEHPEVTALFPDEADGVRLEKNGITVKDLSADGSREISKPIWTFEHAFHNYPDVLSELRQFSEPSPIQCQMWPIVMRGHDVIGIAQTGSGKTLAFLLPAFLHIDGQPTPRSERNGPTVLILTPTRELAQQIEREVRKYHYKDIRSLCIYGGGCRRSQMDICASGVEIVIATPGRLNDLIEASAVKLTSVTYLVLDEADRMLDMGFEPQILKVMHDIRADRHTIMTSATWPRMVRRLGEKYTKDAFHVVVGSLDLAACKSVKQTIIMMPTDRELDVDALKREKVMEFASAMAKNDKALIFVGRKVTADGLASDLLRRRVNCQSIHGDRDQSERERALKELRRGDTRILVATDVASRGLDVPDITHVFNFDFPRNIEDYVHRVGRCGRAGKHGEAITLICREDWRQAQQLVDILQKNNQEVPPDLLQMAERWAQKQAEIAANGGPSRYAERSRDRPRDRGDLGKKGVCDPITGEIIGFLSH